MKKLIGSILCSTVLASASMIGLDALGEEQVMGGMANAAGRGYAGGAKTGDAEGVSLANPARIAFDTKVVFNVNFLVGFVDHSDDQSYFAKEIAIPSFNLSFPMGDFGAMGVSLWQSYSSVFKDDVKDSSASINASMEYQSSVYEIVPSYAVRVPYLRNFALAASAHIVMGNFERSLTLGPNNSQVAEEDAWATNSANITDYVSGTWDLKNHPAYYSAALQYRGRQSSYYFSFTTAHTLENDLSYNFRFSQTDTLAPTRYAREIEVPAMLATGMNFRFFKRNNFMLDLQWRAWDSDVENVAGSYDLASITKTQNDVLASVGLQRDGSTLFYDPYWDRMTYRLGGWYKSWYVKDVFEVGGSIGAGFPLGHKGTTVDLALQGGKRFADDGKNWDETFIGIRLGLMGVGNWGQSRR